MGITGLAMLAMGLIFGTIALFVPAEGLPMTAGILGLLGVVYSSFAWLMAPMQHKSASRKLDALVERLGGVVGVSLGGAHTGGSAVPSPAATSTSVPVEHGRTPESGQPQPLLEPIDDNSEAAYPYGQPAASRRTKTR